MNRLTNSILDYLEIKPSLLSEDYVNNKSQFHLHGLITEQRHHKTWDLSMKIKKSTQQGVENYLLVDEDITSKLEEVIKNPALIYQASKSIENAILNKRKVYIYGCGATGRLAKQIECGFWRPFWNKCKSFQMIWEKLNEHLNYDIENCLIGEITGGDRALISSLEGFEDLLEIGELQFNNHNIKKDDVVFAVTEGGETSSVIGTILEARNQYGEYLNKELNEQSKNNLYFIYNNPNNVLMHLDRCRKVLENDGITKICLATGPQAITGSTRLQATTISTFVIGVIIEHALSNILKKFISDKELKILGFDDCNLENMLSSVSIIQKSVQKISSSIGNLIEIESSCYKRGNFSTYFADSALITIFTDVTERSPTFNLYPLDNVNDYERKSWAQVLTNASNQKDAWCKLLGRNFEGLDECVFKDKFSLIENNFLKEAAFRSLSNAGNDQQYLYDFSLSQFNIERRGPTKGDLLVQVFLLKEIKEILNDHSNFQKILRLFAKNDGSIALIIIVEEILDEKNKIIQNLYSISKEILIIQLPIGLQTDPLNIRQQIAIKMLLNCHSTCLMAKLGRVVGNTMTSVKPGNLKLIGRATYLIQMHVNYILSKTKNILNDNKIQSISYQDANAILFDCIEYTKTSGNSQVKSEVSLSIIRTLEALKRNSNVTWEEARKILTNSDLEKYLINYSV